MVNGWFDLSKARNRLDSIHILYVHYILVFFFPENNMIFPSHLENSVAGLRSFLDLGKGQCLWKTQEFNSNPLFLFFTNSDN